MSLPEVAAEQSWVEEILRDPSMSRREVVETLAERGVKTSSTAVSRWRRNNGVERSESQLEALSSPYPNLDRLSERQRKDVAVPQWSPGIVYDNTGGELRTVPREVSTAISGPPPEDSELLEEFGLDPDVWTITNITKSRWQAGDVWRESFKATFKKRGLARLPMSAEEVNSTLAIYTQPSESGRGSVNGTLVVPVGDLQLGKEEGGGTQATVERFGALTQKVYEMVVDLGGVDRLVLPWLGDCIEGLVSQGGRNISRLDLPISEQVRVYRRLMLHQIAMLAPWANNVLIPVVGGNHDETFRLQTQPVSDSWALEGASAVADALELAGKYNHVQWIFPEHEELNVVVDIGGTTLGMTHGHLWKTNQAINWWKAQSHGRQPIGQADILLSAHLHHMRIEQTGGGRTWIQIPALDGGSSWFRRQTGEDAPAGLMTFWLTPGKGSGWSNLAVHE